MKFFSTRDLQKKSSYSFAQAVELGLAPDGGLFVPEFIPQIDLQQMLTQKLSFQEVAEKVLTSFLVPEISCEELKILVQKSFYFPTPVQTFNRQAKEPQEHLNHLNVLELFHGPTAAFKDVAAQFIAQWMSLKISQPQTILVATSGDTGGAIASAFDGSSKFKVVILFPESGVSPLQKHQLSCWSSNVRSLAVRGTFDDCQKIVKQILSSKKQNSKNHLTTANSINIARLLPQMCYYAAASLEYWQKNQAKVRFIIPTGNMGNAVACFWAQKMGFPIDKIIMTTNENSVLSDFYKTGQLHPQSSKKTLANAMDVGNPSNFERLVNLYPQLDNLLKISKVYLVTDQEIKQSIQSFKQNFDTVICPHTATAYAGYLKMCPLLQQNSIIVATAHPAKFCEVVEPLLNQKVVWPEALLKLGQREAHYETIFPEVERVKEFI